MHLFSCKDEVFTLRTIPSIIFTQCFRLFEKFQTILQSYFSFLESSLAGLLALFLSFRILIKFILHFLCIFPPEQLKLCFVFLHILHKTSKWNIIPIGYLASLATFLITILARRVSSTSNS